MNNKNIKSIKPWIPKLDDNTNVDFEKTWNEIFEFVNHEGNTISLNKQNLPKGVL